MRRQMPLAALALALVLGACSGALPAGTPEADPAPRMTASADGRDLSDPIEVGALAPRNLAAGQCAMFLWMKQGRAQFVFYAESDGTAVMRLNGEERRFSRIAAEGDPAFGQYTRQRFDAGDWELALTVAVEARRGLLGGAVIPRGALRVVEPEGWKRVLPVAGLIACGTGR